MVVPPCFNPDEVLIVSLVGLAIDFGIPLTVYATLVDGDVV